VLDQQAGEKTGPELDRLDPAVEAAAEVTTPPKASMERVAMATWRACTP